eukprot:m.104942 g.104942  ORF g.104942 m.104942 type:complete len:240 (+) comp10544_c0_seq1:260-979(+)
MVISRLKAECGNQFTNRFEQMFKDIQISDDNMKAFSESLGGSAGVTKKIGKLDLDVRVLTTGMWPTQTTNPCILPPVLQAAASVYEEWYLTKHTGRKLTWQTTLGTMTLQARFPKGSKLLSVSTLQGVLLLLFNDTDGPISVTDMLARTEFELVAVVRALQSMSAGKHRVLIKTTEPDTAEVRCTLHPFFSLSLCGCRHVAWWSSDVWWWSLQCGGGGGGVCVGALVKIRWDGVCMALV